MKDDDNKKITTKDNKIKKTGSLLIRKLKLKTQSSQSRKPSTSSPSVSSAESEERAGVSSSLAEEDTEIITRRSPEGLETEGLERAVSDTNLTENWKSAENLNVDEEKDCCSIISESKPRVVLTVESSNSDETLTTKSENRAVNVEIVQIETDQKTSSGKSVLEQIKQDALDERTRSLEDLPAMPAFGELIVDHRVSNHTNATKPAKDHLYKILVIGDLGAGKTSIIKRYVHAFFSQHYRATIGVDFALKVLHWDANTVIRLQLWDIAGQERYGNMTRVYYKEAVGAFIVFDVTRSNTFESVTNWKADLDSKVQLPDGSPIPCVLLGNKCDQQKEGLVNNRNKMEEFCKEKGFAAWFETSAKENINIEEASKALVNEILTNDIINANQNKDKDQFTLTNKKDESKNQKCFKC